MKRNKIFYQTGKRLTSHPYTIIYDNPEITV